jgi:hypothetical protein
MNIISKAVSALGGIVVAALLIAVLAPKATPAIVAALVQVSNTPAAPAITQGVPALASQNIELMCYLATCQNRLSPTFVAYEVPSGESFVVSDMEMATGIGGSDCVAVFAPPPPGEGGNADFFDFAADGRTHQVLFPGGLVYPAGYKFDTTNVEMFGGCNEMWLRGYLTSN